MINLIAAIGTATRAIGRDNDLIWDLPEDLARFRELTRNHPVIMGRKTWESLPRRPLPGRANIVLSRDRAYPAEGARVVTTIEDALDVARASEGADEIYIIGGGQVFDLARPYAERLVLTEVNDDTDGDAHFFEYREDFPIETFREEREENGITYTFRNLERRPSATAS